MNWNINIIAEMLKADAKRYKTEYDKALERKNEEIKEAKEKFIGTTLAEELERINKGFDKKIVDLKVEITKDCIEPLNELKEQELEKVREIDPTVIEKVNCLRDVPLSEDEVVALLEDTKISGNYWAKRVLIEIAEKNNISVVNTGLGATYETKLNILTQLEQQFEEILREYPCANDRYLAPKVNFANLSDTVIERAILLYGGKVDVRTEEERADKAFLHIKAKQSSVDVAFAISNALRNASEECKNRLLYNIATDTSISDISKQMSGYYAEIVDFKNGKASLYASATKRMESLRNAKTKENVEAIVNEAGENEFFAKMYQKELSKNEYLHSVMNPQYSDMSEMTHE